jgi:lysozyme
MVDLVKLKAQLTEEEGIRSKPYVDTQGVLTIGIGRNLRDKGISEDEINYLYQNDVADVTDDLAKNLPWALDLDDVRQRVIYDLCFNIGLGGLLRFHKFIEYAQEGKHDLAAAELQDSLWFNQVGKRGPKLVEMYRTGVDQ